MHSLHFSGTSHAEYLEVNGRKRASMFFRRGKGMEFIKAGSSFRRVHPDRSVETARVLSVASDSFGIPHVRYEVVFERAQRTVVDGPRILALSTFTDTYRERVTA